MKLKVAQIYRMCDSQSRWRVSTAAGTGLVVLVGMDADPGQELIYIEKQFDDFLCDHIFELDRYREIKEKLLNGA